MGDFAPYLLKSADRGDLDVDRRRLARARYGLLVVAQDPSIRPALRRHRVRSLLHRRRRQELDPVKGAAADPGARHRDPAAGERPGDRHLRPRLLDSRRPAPLRRVDDAIRSRDATLFPGGRPSLSWADSSPSAIPGKTGFQGASYYAARPTRRRGAVFTIRPQGKTCSRSQRRQRNKRRGDLREGGRQAGSRIRRRPRASPPRRARRRRRYFLPVVRRRLGRGGAPHVDAPTNTRASIASPGI